MNAKIRKPLLWLLSAQNNKEGKIFFYHDLVGKVRHTDMGTPIGLFRSHVAMARKLGWTVVDRVPYGRKELQICFDDGFEGAWDCREELMELGVKPTIYLAVEHIDKAEYLTKAQVIELHRMGFNFESHTWSHAWLTECDSGQLRHELGDSRKFLSDFLGKEITQICFPRGLFSKKVYDASIEAGYSDLVSSIPGSINQGVMSHVLPRNLVQSYVPSEVKWVLKGALGSLRGRYFKRHYLQEG